MSCEQESDELAHAVGSVCNFRCNRGFRLVGDDESVCVATGDGAAVYSKPTPVCQRESSASLSSPAPPSG